jgi:HEPN domain-containing protein
MKKSTKEWVKKAEDDWRMARSLSRASYKAHDGVCFHGQQSAEKYLKALMEEIGTTIPKTHNLVDLQHALSAHHPSLVKLQRGLVFLKQFAVEFRYPGKNATLRQATAALRWTGRIRAACRSILGLP